MDFFCVGALDTFTTDLGLGLGADELLEAPLGFAFGLGVARAGAGDLALALGFASCLSAEGESALALCATTIKTTRRRQLKLPI